MYEDSIHYIRMYALSPDGAAEIQRCLHKGSDRAFARRFVKASPDKRTSEALNHAGSWTGTLAGDQFWRRIYDRMQQIERTSGWEKIIPDEDSVEDIYELR